MPNVKPVKADPATYEEWLDADEVLTRRIIENKNELIGTPFGITSATFRSTEYADTDRDYVSLEILIFETGELAVLNDGSTGIRRQIVNYLQSKELLTNNDPDLAVPAGDLQGPHNIRLKVPHGLRVSEYENEHGKAATYYLS